MYPTSNSPFGSKPAIHIEFRLKNWAKIKKILSIKSVYELGKAEDIFKNLEQRYLSYEKEIDRRLLIKHFIRNGANPDFARRRVECFFDIQHFKEWTNWVKDQVKRKKRLQPLRRKMHGTAPIMNRHDKFMLNLRVGYYLRDKK